MTKMTKIVKDWQKWARKQSGKFPFEIDWATEPKLTRRRMGDDR